jgi:hypothetical protein
VLTGYPSNWKVLTNAAVVSDLSADTFTYDNSMAYPNDHYSEIVFSSTDSAHPNSGYGASVRCALAAQSGYRVTGSGAGYEFWEVVAGVATSLKIAAGTTFTAGDALRLRCIGALLIAYKNLVQFDSFLTDGSLTTGRPGLAYSSTVASGGIASWAAGSFSTGANNDELLMLGVS